jgi:hypothetical protein
MLSRPSSARSPNTPSSNNKPNTTHKSPQKTKNENKKRKHKRKQKTQTETQTVNKKPRKKKPKNEKKVMDVVEKIFVDMFKGLEEQCAKDLATIAAQYPCEPIQMNPVRLTFEGE